MLQAKITGTNRHRLLVPDPGLRLLREFDGDGRVVWELKTPGLSYDAWKLPDGTYLYAYIGAYDAPSGVIHCQPDGTALSVWGTDSQVFSCQPLPGGGFLAGELNACRLSEFGGDGQLLRRIPLRSACVNHNLMRMCRKCPDGTYLVNQPDDRVIRRYDDRGKILQELPTPGDTFAVFPDGKGNIFYTAKKEIFCASPDGSIIWHASEADLAPITPCFLTGMTLLENGNLLVTNWLGHGMAGQGAPIFELTPAREIVWTLSAPDFTDCQANIQCLDEDAAGVIAQPKR